MRGQTFGCDAVKLRYRAGRSVLLLCMSLTADEFRIHINDPGEGVNLRLVPARGPAVR